MYPDKVLLVTGGTGSFGNSVVKKYLTTDIKEIRIFSRDEFKQEQTRKAVNDSRVTFRIGDVRDAKSVRSAMQGVDYVFHAAAMKVVPTCEQFPLEAIKTNTLGSENVFDAAINAGVSKVVALSTDKAVQPTNVMGASKMLMERILLAKAAQNTGTTFCLTRYGNVMGSRGSVIPKFIEQLQACDRLTITNPDMTRFMMSIEEAVDLVMLAFEHGGQGDTFVKKVPAVTMLTLASAVASVFSAETIGKVIGSRPGEKIHETLVTAEEMVRTADCDDYYRIFQTGAVYPYDTEDYREEYTSENAERLSLWETVSILKQLDFVQKALCSQRT